MASILLTGGSSFSGLWIAEALAAAGHEVTAVLTKSPADYHGIRAQRVNRLRTAAQLVYDAPVEAVKFRELVGEGFDLLALHGAQIANYRSSTYDFAEGLKVNLNGVQRAIEAHAQVGGRAVLSTGTSFEAKQGNGAGDDLSVSPYGLSKYLTNETVRHLARWAGLGFGKFVIAAPFGRWEEGRFCWSLFQSWFEGQPGVVRTPRFIRDNIPAPLLAGAYVDLAESLLREGQTEHVARPSGFVGTQEEFARRLAAAMTPRLNLACEVESAPQAELTEPLVRINDQPTLRPDWPEDAFWDDYADYYSCLAGAGLLKGAA